MWKWYATVGIVWKKLWILSLTVPKWNGLLFIILAYLTKFHWVLCDWSFSSFGLDIDMRRIRNDKTLRLGIPKAPQFNIQGRSKQLSLGMPRKASPLSSPTISVTLLEAIFSFVTWYVFCLERHFFRICLLLLIIMCCIFIFNKNVKDSFYHAYFASIHVVSKQKVYRCCKHSLEKSESDIMLNIFCIIRSDKSYAA